MKHYITLISLTAALGLCACTANFTPTPPGTQDVTLQAAPPECHDVPGIVEQACTSPATGLHYWLYRPGHDVSAQATGLPLLVYLHGFNHSGSDLDRLLAGGLPAQIEHGRALAMIVVSPQCPAGQNWQDGGMIERISRFADEMVAAYGADPKRTYLTGFSMGGDGVWAIGAAYPRQFAALAPVGSWYSDTDAACALKDVPVWVFQGEQDEIVAPSFAKAIVNALQQCGGHPKLTLFPHDGHGASSQSAYATEALYSWLLEW